MRKCVNVCVGAVIGSGWTRLDIEKLQLAPDRTHYKTTSTEGLDL